MENGEWRMENGEGERTGGHVLSVLRNLYFVILVFRPSGAPEACGVSFC